MPDFHGTVDITTEKGRVEVHASAQEKLLFTINVSGAQGRFNLARGGTTLWDQSTLSSKAQRQYVVSWSPQPGTNHLYVLGFSFLTATEYSVLIEKMDSSNSVVEEVARFTISSPNRRDDVYPHTMRIIGA